MKLQSWLALTLALAMLFSLAACGGAKEPENPTTETTLQRSNEIDPTGTGDNNLETTTDETDETGSATGDKTSNKTGGVTTAKSATATSRVTSATTGAGIKPVTIRSGDKRLTDGLNFGGKTFTLATSGTESNFENTVKSFQTKYNCKVNISRIGWEEYSQKLLEMHMAGKPYDIMYMHALHFPTHINRNLVAPIQDTITTADLWNSKNTSAGGISEQILQGLAWNNNLYTMAGAYSVAPIIIFYNKKMFKDAGLEDPYELYKQGKWTWDKLKQMGKDVTDASRGIFFMGGEHIGYCQYVTMSNGGLFVTLKDGQIRESLSDPKLLNGLKLFQELTNGKNKIVTDTGGFHDSDPFITGKVYTFFVETYGWENLATLADRSNVFGKTRDNLGYVPIPLGPDNTNKAYPVHAYQGYCAGNGVNVDKRAAAAFAIFESTYKNPVGDTRPADYTALTKKLLDGIIITPYNGFNSSTTNSDGIAIAVGQLVANGDDIAKTTSNYRQQLQDCIDTSLKGG